LLVVRQFFPDMSGVVAAGREAVDGLDVSTSANTCERSPHLRTAGIRAARDVENLAGVAELLRSRLRRLVVKQALRVRNIGDASQDEHYAHCVSFQNQHLLCRPLSVITDCLRYGDQREVCDRQKQNPPEVSARVLARSGCRTQTYRAHSCYPTADNHEADLLWIPEIPL